MSTHLLTGVAGIPSEIVTIALPRLWTRAGAKPAVILLPGSDERFDFPVKPFAAPIINALTDAGYPVACASPVNQWGNPYSRTWITSLRTYMQSSAVGARSGKIGLIGLSQGTANALSWAGANPTLTGAVTAYLPAPDLNYAPFKSSIDGAYGGNYTEASYGAAYNPQTMAAAGKYAGIPIDLITASNDTTTPAALATAFKNAVGANAVIRNGGATGHEWAVTYTDPAIRAALLTQMAGV